MPNPGTGLDPEDRMMEGDGMPANQAEPDTGGTIGPRQPDWYFENGLLVYTAAYHLKRGHCCGSGCRHCPYDPLHVEGNAMVARQHTEGLR